jgi:hypothetical protein
MSWRGAGRYALLGGALFALLAARSRGDAWVGDFWIYAATVGELAARPFHPTNPLFGNEYAFAFLSPYTLVLGLVSRLSGLAALDVLAWQGLVNLVLLGAALYAFVAAWLRRPAASFYALLFVLFLWGRDPWRYSSFFHLRSLAYVIPYPSTFASALALGTLAAFPRLVGSVRSWMVVVFPVATFIWIVHPVTGLFLWVGLVAYSLGAPRSRWHWPALGLAAVAAFGLAMAWPMVPMPELWFGQVERVHEGNDLMYVSPFPRIAPALLGVPWLLLRLRRNPRDPIGLFALGLGGLVVYGGVSGQWSYGRLISHLVVLLQLALADALVSLEERLGRLRRGALLRHLVAPTVAVLMVAWAWPVVRSVLAETGPGDRRWLAFLETRVGRDDVVLTDVDTCWYVPAFQGRVVAYPMKLPFVPDHADRLAAVARFFERGVPKQERSEILDRYDVNYVLLPKGHFDDWPERLAELRGLGSSVYSSPEYELLLVEPHRNR